MATQVTPYHQERLQEYYKRGKISLLGEWADIQDHINAIDYAQIAYEWERRDVSDALGKWEYATPVHMDLRIEHAGFGFLPGEPGGALQPGAQPQAQPQQGAPLSEEARSFLEQQLGAPIPTTPGIEPGQISGPTTTPATAPLSDDTMSWLERRGAGAR